MSMNLNISLQEEPREFTVLGERVTIHCDDIQYNHIIMYITNVHAFGKYYYDTWKSIGYNHYDSQIYRKLAQLDSIIIAKLPEYEETVLKERRRDYNINSLLD